MSTEEEAAATLKFEALFGNLTTPMSPKEVSDAFQTYYDVFPMVDLTTSLFIKAQKAYSKNQGLYELSSSSSSSTITPTVTLSKKDNPNIALLDGLLGIYKRLVGGIQRFGTEKFKSRNKDHQIIAKSIYNEFCAYLDTNKHKINGELKPHHNQFFGSFINSAIAHNPSNLNPKKRLPPKRKHLPEESLPPLEHGSPEKKSRSYEIVVDNSPVKAGLHKNDSDNEDIELELSSGAENSSDEDNALESDDELHAKEESSDDEMPPHEEYEDESDEDEYDDEEEKQVIPNRALFSLPKLRGPTDIEKAAAIHRVFIEDLKQKNQTLLDEIRVLKEQKKAEEEKKKVGTDWEKLYKESQKRNNKDATHRYDTYDKTIQDLTKQNAELRVKCKHAEMKLDANEVMMKKVITENIALTTATKVKEEPTGSVVPI